MFADTGVRVFGMPIEDFANFSPHLFRRLALTWMANGNNETGLMRLMGWKLRSTVTRYGASAADERAHDAHRRAALGDRF